MLRKIKSVITLTLCLFVFILTARTAQTLTIQPGQQEASLEGLEFFEKKIRPVLVDNCYVCHSTQSKKPQGGLSLDSIEGMLKGGASGEPAVIPGDPEKSILIKAIRYTDAKLQMPLGGKLPDPVIKDFEQWVRMGAPAPRQSVAKSAGTWASYNFDEARKFWSFQPVKDSTPPAVKNSGWVKTPIDRFILAALEKKGLKPVTDAGKRTLIRRATFDLTGLPPTPEEVDAFLGDKSPAAFEKVVDRLLASPAYGETWGRHWLDLVRYADTAGDNSDYPVPAAYRYRNYVIESFNKDKPYDQFIRKQISGDLLAKHRASRVDGKLPEEEDDDGDIPTAKKLSAAELEKSRQEKIIATGYLAMSRRFGSRNKEMNLTIDDTIDNLGKTFLGLSTSCARCHDHKFDPIPQRDYYALYGIFNSTRYSFPGAEIYPHPAEMVGLNSGPDAERFYKIQKELSELDDRVEFLKVEKGAAARNKAMKEQAAAAAAKGNNQSGQQAGQEGNKSEEKGTEFKPADFDRDADNSRRAGQSKRMPEEVDAEMQRVRARISELHARYKSVSKAYAVVEGMPANARVHRKGDPKNLGDEAPRGFLTILGAQQVPRGHEGSGREYLADWIADPKNPLTPRVMVNRIWQWHFGKGLVQTTNDFGVRGRAPSHPELLDWLAARFIEGGWSIKKVHRMIMLSRVYQLASREEIGVSAKSSLFASNAATDVNNDYLWRFDRRRLSAEETRDAILSMSKRLDRTMGEEHPFPPEQTWRFSQHVQFFGVYDTDRRSVYVMQQRLKKHPFFEVFDGADTNMPVGERPLSTTPLQALFLMNNPWFHEQADYFAVRIGMAYEPTAERVDHAFRLAYGRHATPEEINEAAVFLQQAKLKLQKLKIPTENMTRMLLASYCRVLMSSNEFLYVD
ncbi:MAG: PSD1 and planctomycete cytochrome C domain-containing protein [Acidobacteria bacterium]|nr:PSD1 and planctomycete cytochrome C domain-containing protein [Acidobacteriota bacterium]